MSYGWVIIQSVAMLNIIMLSIIVLSIDKINVIITSVAMTNVIMLSVGMPNVIMLSVANAECVYIECCFSSHHFFTIRLSVIVLNVVALIWMIHINEHI